MTKFLADVNFLLAVLDIKHEHSVRANSWLNQIEEPDSIGICRVVQMGVLRLLTKQSVMQAGVLSGEEAWGYLTMLFEDDRFFFLHEPTEFESAWKAICGRIAKGASAETDTYLAAFAISGELSIISFDMGLVRFSGLRLESPV